MTSMCEACEATARVNQRYRTTIELLTRERDELRELEMLLVEILRDKVTEGDAGLPRT